MSDAKAKVTQLISTLGQDIELAMSLSVLLDEQHTHVSLVNSEGLEKVNPKIEHLTAQIRDHATERSVILRSFGLDPSDEGLKQLAQKLPPAMREKMVGLCEDLKIQIEGCKLRNRKSADQLIRSKELLQSVIGNQEEGYPEQIV